MDASFSCDFWVKRNAHEIALANSNNSAVSQLSQTTQQNASSSEELAATSEEMSSQVEQLQQTMSFFKLDNVGDRGLAATPHKQLAAKKKVMAKTSAFKLSTASAGGDGMHIDESKFSKF